MKVVVSIKNICVEIYINFHSITGTSVFIHNAQTLSHVTVNRLGRTRDGTLGWATAPQVRMSRVLFPMVPLTQYSRP